eukprot:6723423-Pyramimonas_sp.AAC.1
MVPLNASSTHHHARHPPGRPGHVNACVSLDTSSPIPRAGHLPGGPGHPQLLRRKDPTSKSFD